VSGHAAKAVLFDLDGTLVDTAPDLTAAVDRVLRERGRAPVDPGRLAAVVSKGGRAMLQVAFPELDEAARERLLPEFLQHYGENIAGSSRLYPGVEAVLAHIESQGLPWAVVTNKPEALASKLMTELALLARCAVLVGGDTLAQRKPSPEPLWHACAQLGIDPAHCVYVGDDERDVLAARAAGMPAVVALWGYRSEGDDPADWPAQARCEQALDLLETPWLASAPISHGG